MMGGGGFGSPVARYVSRLKCGCAVHANFQYRKMEHATSFISMHAFSGTAMLSVSQRGPLDIWFPC